MAKYPDVAKLKEKYSPQKRIPIAMLDGKPIFGGINSLNTKLTRDDAGPISTGTRITRNLGGFSPIRRSGSPVRRQNISQIEQEVSRKRRKDEETGEPDEEDGERRKKKTVTFNSDVQYDGEHEMAPSGIEINEIPQNIHEMAPPGIETNEIPQNNHEISPLNDPQLISKLLHFVSNIDQRLDVIENTQKQIITHLQSKDSEKVPEKLESLHESIKELIQSIRRPS